MLSWSRRSCIQTGTSKKLTSWHSLSYWTFRLAWFMDYKFYKPCMMGLRLWILLLLVISDDLSPLPTDRFGYFFYYDFIWIVFFFMPSPGFVVSLWSSKFLLFRWIFHTFFFFFRTNSVLTTMNTYNNHDQISQICSQAMIFHTRGDRFSAYVLVL